MKSILITGGTGLIGSGLVKSIDKSIYKDSYIEDCEICCNPIEIEYTTDGHEILSFSAISIEQ